MDLSKFKLGAGPMSKEIVNLLIDYSHNNNYPLMIIASRNQVDYNSGYVSTTSELVKQIKEHSGYDSNRILICRDHCGPYFSDADKGKSIENAMHECFRTIEADIVNGFDLIHIDVSRITDNQFHYAKQLIEYAISLKSDIMLEFGSEDNTNEKIEECLLRVDEQLQFLSKYKDNIKFFVSQTGSLTKHTQIGTFNYQQSRLLVDKTHKNGFLFKEHNADYLMLMDLEDRANAGVDAVNIAPMLGSTQTYVLASLGQKYKNDLDAFSKYVIEQNVWSRWVTIEVNDDETKLLVSGHYYYNTDSYQALFNKIDKTDFYNFLKKDIFNILDVYKRGLDG
jgi:hypothetical protein